MWYSFCYYTFFKLSGLSPPNCVCVHVCLCIPIPSRINSAKPSWTLQMPILEPACIVCSSTQRWVDLLLFHCLYKFISACQQELFSSFILNEACPEHTSRTCTLCTEVQPTPTDHEKHSAWQLWAEMGQGPRQAGGVPLILHQ